MAPSSLARVAGRAGPEAPIDLVQLATNTLGNRDLEVQVLHLFKSQSSSTLERLARESDAVSGVIWSIRSRARPGPSARNGSHSSAKRWKAKMQTDADAADGWPGVIAVVRRSTPISGTCWTADANSGGRIAARKRHGP